MKWLHRLGLLIKLAAVVAIAAIFMQYPGFVQFEWFDYRIQTSVALFFVVLLFVLIGCGIIMTIVKGIWHFPQRWLEFRARCRRKKAAEALVEGIVAIAAGELEEAEKLARFAIKTLPDQPLNRVIAAQALFLQGKMDEAQVLFRELQQHKATRFLGFRGEALQSMRQGEWGLAQKALRQAAAARPDSPWALKYLLEVDLRLGVYDRGEGALKQLQTRRLISKHQYKRYQALIAWLKAEATETHFYHQAKKAHELAPELIGVAVALGAYEIKAGHNMRAQKVLAQTWHYHPHPELMRLLKKTFPVASNSLDFYRYLEGISKGLEAPEVHLLLAEAALEAKLWGQVRQHLQACIPQQETQQVCQLMADLSRLEDQNEEKAQFWTQKVFHALPNQAWVCEKCQSTTMVWDVFCKSCSGFDTLHWQIPHQNASKNLLLPQLI